MNEGSLKRVARHIRHAVLASFRSIGGFSLVAASPWRRRRLLILCYHGVSLKDEHEWDAEMFVTPGFLRRRFEILRDKGYVVLPLVDAVRRLNDGTLPPHSVALTFDDGFYNFFAAAAPLLEEFGYPATVYLSSYHCLNQRPLLALTLRYLVWRTSLQTLPAETLPGQFEPVNLGDSRHREKLVVRLLADARALSHDHAAQQAWLGQLATRLGIDWGNIVQSRLFHLMAEEEVVDISRRGFDIQLHTHRHRTPKEESAFRFEVCENQRIIKKLTGMSATHFCYPSGVVDPAFLPWLRDIGVETATTCVVGLAQAGHDPLLLPRYIDTMAQTEVQFEGWLSGAAEGLKWRGK